MTPNYIHHITQRQLEDEIRRNTVEEFRHLAMAMRKIFHPDTIKIMANALDPLTPFLKVLRETSEP